MKFKVGDTVRIRNDLKADQRYGFHIVNQDMVNMGDSLYTIEEILAFPDHITYRLEGSCWAWTEEMLEPADSKTLRMADGTIIGEFNTGGVVSIHDLPTSEWYNPMRLTFKNGSSIEALPQKDDAVRGENHFCNGFRGGKIPTSSELIVSHTEMEKAMDALLKALEKPSVKFGIKKLEQKLKEEKNLKFTFYVTEGYRMDKSNNTKIPTITTEVLVNGVDYQYSGSATCDKADYSERDGILNAIANAVCCGNFDREYEKFLANKKRKYDESCKCKICGRNYYEDEKTGKRTPFTPEDARKHEEWHEQNKKNKREKYLIRKEAKRRLAEAEREGKIEQTMKELYKK